MRPSEIALCDLDIGGHRGRTMLHEHHDANVWWSMQQGHDGKYRMELESDSGDLDAIACAIIQASALKKATGQ